MQSYWNAHWVSRWGASSEHKSADGRELPITAEGFGQRANLEMAWRTTRWAPIETAGAAVEGGGSSEQPAAVAIEGRMPLRSTVSCSAALLSAPQHEVCAIGFDQTRGHCVTGDSDGLVRVWDVAKCVDAVSTGDQMDKECRLGLHRLHHKGHAVRWTAIHGRRLLAGCGAKDDGSAAGRLVLIDLDDSSTNAGQRNPGVGSSPLDARCGLIGTGVGAGNYTSNPPLPRYL